MTLLCGSAFDAAFLPLPTRLIIIAALVAPVLVYLALPRLLDWRNHLKWTFASVLHPLAWFASLVERNEGERRSWGTRLREALLADVQRHWPAGRMGAVAGDPAIVHRARRMGRVAGLVALVPPLGLGAIALWRGELIVGPAAVAVAPLVAWLAAVGGSSGAFVAAAMAKGRPRVTRALLGALLGVAYGLSTGATSALVATGVIMLGVSMREAQLIPQSLALVALTMSAITGAAAGLMLAPVLCARAALRSDAE